MNVTSLLSESNLKKKNQIHARVHKPKSSRCLRAMAGLITDGMQLSVLTLGVEFLHTVPSFSVISVPLRQVTVQIEETSGSV